MTSKIHPNKNMFLTSTLTPFSSSTTYLEILIEKLKEILFKVIRRNMEQKSTDKLSNFPDGVDSKKSASRVEL